MKDELAKTIVVLISGKAGVGKTTSQKFLLKYLISKGYVPVSNSFASGVKDVAAEMGWDGKKDDRGRKLLQNIGKVGREYDKDIWIKYSMAILEDYPPIDFLIYDDWRFPNELEYFKNRRDLQVVTVRVMSPEREMLKNSPLCNDESEVALKDEDDYDYIFDNNSTLEVLESICEDIADNILEEAQKWE